MTSDMYAQLGAEIRRRRETIGLSQAQLAERVGVGRTSVTMIERGAQSLLVHQMIEISKALRIEPSALLESVIEIPVSKGISQTPFEIDELLSELKRPVVRLTRR